MFYDLFYELFSNLVGTTAMSTEQGQLFATYGSYIFIVIAIIMVFGIAKKIMNWLTNSIWN